LNQHGGCLLNQAIDRYFGRILHFRDIRQPTKLPFELLITMSRNSAGRAHLLVDRQCLALAAAIENADRPSGLALMIASLTSSVAIPHSTVPPD